MNATNSFIDNEPLAYKISVVLQKCQDVFRVQSFCSISDMQKLTAGQFLLMGYGV